MAAANADPLGTCYGYVSKSTPTCEDFAQFSQCVSATENNPQVPAEARNSALAILEARLSSREECRKLLEQMGAMPPRIISDDKGLNLQVSGAHDVAATRLRRETVSLFALKQDVDTIKTSLDAMPKKTDVDIAIATLVGQVNAINTEAVSGRVDAMVVQISAVAQSQATSGASVTAVQGQLTQLSSAVSTLTAKVGALETGSAAVKVKSSNSACSSATIGMLRLNKGGLEACLDGKEWVKVTTTGSQDGKTPESAASSCKALRADGVTTSGAYYIKVGSAAPFKAYCEMQKDGGGWTLVAKANNRDTKRWYGKGNSMPFETGTLFNTALCDTNTKGDALCPAYRASPGSELMIYDQENSDFISGNLKAFTSLYAKFKSYPRGSRVSGTLSCAETASNIRGVGKTIIGHRATSLGIKCEDDGQSTWRCDDDAIYIGLYKINSSHRNGIGKCGSDGGDDIYNSENTAGMRSGAVMIMVR